MNVQSKHALLVSLVVGAAIGLLLMFLKEKATYLIALHLNTSYWLGTMYMVAILMLVGTGASYIKILGWKPDERSWTCGVVVCLVGTSLPLVTWDIEMDDRHITLIAGNTATAVSAYVGYQAGKWFRSLGNL